MHILSPETDNCPSWISGRERMTIENISWSISSKECCRPRRGLNLRPPGLQSNGASNWATEAGYIYVKLNDWTSNSVDLDETAHYEPSHLDLCCLQKPIFIAYGSERVKVLSKFVADDILKLILLFFRESKT